MTLDTYQPKEYSTHTGHWFLIKSSCRHPSNDKTDPVIPWKDNSPNVIPGNVADMQVQGKITRCTVDIEWLGDSAVKVLPKHPPKH